MWFDFFERYIDIRYDFKKNGNLDCHATNFEFEFHKSSWYDGQKALYHHSSYNTA